MHRHADAVHNLHEPSVSDRYMVVWRMEEANNFLTMVIDLESRTLFTSALMGYETEQEGVLFDEATIHRVER